MIKASIMKCEEKTKWEGLERGDRGEKVVRVEGGVEGRRRG